MLWHRAQRLAFLLLQIVHDCSAGVLDMIDDPWLLDFWREWQLRELFMFTLVKGMIVVLYLLGICAGFRCPVSQHFGLSHHSLHYHDCHVPIDNERDSAM